MNENECEKLCCRNPMHDSVSIVQESEMILNPRKTKKNMAMV